jgi:gas vesicle protein
MQNKNSSSKVNSKMLGMGAAAVVGAGLAVTAAAVLRDEKNRKKIGQAVSKAKQKAGEYLDTLDTSMQNARENVKDAAANVRDEAAELVDTTKQKSRQIAKSADRAADKAADKVKDKTK